MPSPVSSSVIFKYFYSGRLSNVFLLPLFFGVIKCFFFVGDAVIEAPTRQVPPGAVVGDRFHPTDQELVDYYLRRYISASGYEGNELPIAEVNVYKVEPRDLPGKHCFLVLIVRLLNRC